MDVLAVAIGRGARWPRLADEAPQAETVSQLHRRRLDAVALREGHRLGRVQEEVIEALQDGLEGLRLLPNIELHRVAGDQPGMLQLLEDAQLVTRFHASQEHDRNPALVGGQGWRESPVCPLV